MVSLLTWPLLFTFLFSYMKSIHTMMSAVTSVMQLWNKKMKIISSRLIDILQERYLRLDLNWLFWNQSNCNIQSESETIQFTKCWIIKDQTCNQEQFWERLYIKSDHILVSFNLLVFHWLGTWYNILINHRETKNKTT